MNAVILLARLLLCVVFLIAGLAKLAIWPVHGRRFVILGRLSPLPVEETALVSHFNFLRARDQLAACFVKNNREWLFQAWRKWTDAVDKFFPASLISAALVKCRT